MSETPSPAASSAQPSGAGPTAPPLAEERRAARRRRDWAPFSYADGHARFRQIQHWFREIQLLIEDPAAGQRREPFPEHPVTPEMLGSLLADLCAMVEQDRQLLADELLSHSVYFHFQGATAANDFRHEFRKDMELELALHRRLRRRMMSDVATERPASGASLQRPERPLPEPPR